MKPRRSLVQSLTLAVSLSLILAAGLPALAAPGKPEPGKAGAASESAQEPARPLTVMTVDLPLLFTFHPAMRNFDYHSGKFVSQVPYTPPVGGLKAWKALEADRKKVAELEASMAGQLGRVNAEMAANNRPFDPVNPASSPLTWQEFEKYTELTREHHALLSALAQEVLGGFPDSLLGGLPEADLQRISQDVFEAVEAEAQAQKGGIVLNLPTPEMGSPQGSGTATTGPGPRPGEPQDLLGRWNIKTLQELEELVNQASGSSPLPFGKALPPKDPSKYCGGHFESVTDPAFLRTLCEEYAFNRETFCSPFEKFGVRRRVLKGSLDFVEKDITIAALMRIFDKYKTRKLEREAVSEIIRRRRGGQ